MFQLSQESSVIYQEAVPLHHDADLPRRRFYRYVRTSSSSSSSAMSSSSRMMTSSMTSSSASPVRRQAAPLSPRNRLDDGYDGTPARKVMALRQTTDYFLHVSTRYSTVWTRIGRRARMPHPHWSAEESVSVVCHLLWLSTDGEEDVPSVFAAEKICMVLEKSYFFEGVGMIAWLRRCRLTPAFSLFQVGIPAL